MIFPSYCLRALGDSKESTSFAGALSCRLLASALIGWWTTTLKLFRWWWLKVKSVLELSDPFNRSLSWLPFHEAGGLGVSLLPPGWDDSPSQGYPQHFIRLPWQFARTHLISCERKLFCPRTQHNDPARDDDNDEDKEGKNGTFDNDDKGAGNGFNYKTKRYNSQDK